MLREAAASSSLRRGVANSSRNHPQEDEDANENEFRSSPNTFPFPPPRTPLNSIPDPSQCHGETQDSDFDSKDTRLQTSKKLESLDRLGVGGAGSYATPSRALNRHGKPPHSEPNSAQSTPARSASRASLGGGGGATGTSVVPCTGGPRSAQLTKGKDASSFSSRISRGVSVSVADSNISVDVQHFDLEADPRFWKDHNVQVLIRIRPLSTMERGSPGNGRCLRQDSAQTLTWLGHPETRFTFDHIACETISQEKLFTVAGLPMVENCMSGYNSCMFAYGQTGSGKTYTMMGEINWREGRLNDDCGITPRIFEYLFSRIKKEEDCRRDENLKFSCKCSFLEIYNEQIMDLLEPSSLNLQLREDLKKGVYVENLTEYNVRNVNDVIKLLLQGTANRKIAATHMNSESSRSHSVFTCIIESWWEKDSMTHFRFARLNLVDLAGSERQKSSGAEGDRLKEAANINKSLSTLGLVIMSLVDLAHGKQRHIPYRDSRLTFLLQDSLGGNSKTTIIANVSPSICSAHETLSTLKFAQRAKLIRNNAKVNEDASGDVSALQRQIQQLKDQLSFLMKHSLSRSPSNCVQGFGQQGDSSTKDRKANSDRISSGGENNKMKCMEAALFGALRREKMAENSLRKLRAEIEHMDQLACQKEEDMQHTKMMLRFKDEKIKQLELLLNGSFPADHYLREENKCLKEEIELLQTRIDRNPKLTHFALENLRLLEQLQLFQNFYEQDERETLLAEISDLRDQLLEIYGRNLNLSRYENQDNNKEKELEDYRNLNIQLMREVDELQEKWRKCLSCSQDAFGNVLDTFSKDPEEIRHTDKYSLMETVSTGSDLGDEIASYIQADDDDLELQNARNQSNRFATKGSEDIKSNALRTKLDELSKNLEEARLLNCQYQEDQELWLSHQRQTELVCEQVEIETSRTILHLQGEVAALQLELNEKLCSTTQENLMLRKGIAAKEEELRKLGKEWEWAILELTSFLVEGSKSLKDASSQIENIVSSFPQVNGWISEHVERAARACIDKEVIIFHLQENLEDAQKMVVDMELKLNSLKKATMAMNGFSQSDSKERVEVATHVSTLSNENINRVKWLRSQIKYHEEENDDAAGFQGKHNDIKKDTDFSKLAFTANIDSQTTSQFKNDEDAMSVEDQQELENLILDSENGINTSCMDEKVQIAAVQSEILEASTARMNLVRDSVKEIQEMRCVLTEIKDHTCYPSSTAKLHGLEQSNFLKFDNHLDILYPIRDELAKMNEILKIIEDSIEQKMKAVGCPVNDEYLTEADAWSAESSTSTYSTSGCDFSTGNAILGRILDDEYSSPCHPQLSGDTNKLTQEVKMQTGSACEPEKLLARSHQDEIMTFCLRKGLDMAFDTFSKLYVHLMTMLSENWCVEETKRVVPSCGLRKETTEACCHGTRKVVPNDTLNFVSTFFRNCEESHTTMMEADYVLNASLKANESAKQLNGMCKQASNELMLERLCLIEENEQLSSSICLLKRENKFLLNEIHHGMVEMANSMSSLEGCFLQMQTEVEDKYRILYSEVLAAGNEMLYSICNLRSSLEEFCLEMMEKGFTAYVLYHCLAAETMEKIPSSDVQLGFNPLRQLEDPVILSSLQNICSGGQKSIMAPNANGIEERDQNELVASLEDEELAVSRDHLVTENLFLKEELERKEFLLKGLLFDFSLLQETASNRKDMKDETEKLVLTSNKVQHELELKTRQLDDLAVQLRKFECHLSDTENALFVSHSNLDQAKETIDVMSEQNAELRMLLKDLYLKQSEAQVQLDEHKQVIKGLEDEIIHLTATAERKLCASAEAFEKELRKVTGKRDQLYEEICSLNDKLDMAYALADENEAIAMEARQESEASKVYAEQKEEEVKILERSVEELEYTINVLEEKVHEMDEEVERHQLVRDSLELELQSLRHRLLRVENFSDTMNFDNESSVQSGDPMSRQLHARLLELHEARNQIRLLGKEIADKNKEITQCKEYISELVLHSEAQASQYQEKYKTLEAMVRGVKENPSNTESAASTLDRSDKSSQKTRGSSSPFRCIANLVQQMNAEKDQELSVARLRIEELESLLNSRQKEVCMLNARLAAAESMTHDVIRDLLGVKMDMTNYANLIDQHQVQKLVEEGHQQMEDLQEKEQEILNLKKQIDNLAEERHSCICEINKKAADMLAAQMSIEELKEQDELLSTQNEMLKMDKSNLLRRVAELDEMVKTLLGAQSSSQQRMQYTSKIKEHDVLKLDDVDLTKRLAQSEILLSRVNDELSQYRKSACQEPPCRWARAAK